MNIVVITVKTHHSVRERNGVGELVLGSTRIIDMLNSSVSLGSWSALIHHLNHHRSYHPRSALNELRKLFLDFAFIHRAAARSTPADYCSENSNFLLWFAEFCSFQYAQKPIERSYWYFCAVMFLSEKCVFCTKVHIFTLIFHSVYRVWVC